MPITARPAPARPPRWARHRALLAGALTLIGLAIGGGARAEVRQLGPHIHGVSTLDIAADGQALSLELQSPGADIVGFESPPANDDQRRAVTEGIAMLSRPLDLFNLPAAAQCSVVEASAAEVFLNGSDAGPAAAPPPPSDNPFDRYVQQAAHAVFDATYGLRCAHPEALTTIDVRVFSVFPATQLVHVQVVTRRGQFVFDVTRGQPRLDVAGAF